MIAPVSAALLAIKTCALIGFAVYALFAAIMVRQENLMSHVLEEGFEPVLRLLTIVHFAAAVGVFLFAIILL